MSEPQPPIRMSRPDHGCRRFEGKFGIVTAATLGIGRAIAERLCEEGAEILISSRKQANVDQTVEEMRAKGLKVHGMACNVGVDAEQQAMVDKAVELFGRVDLLVGNAAANPVAGLSLDCPDDAYNKIFDINVKSYWKLCQMVRPHLGEKASIVFIASIGAFLPSPPIGLYSVSKTTLVALTKALAQDLGPHGIRINAVAPGVVRTRFARSIWDSPAGKRTERGLWLRKLGDPEDIAGPVAFLLSQDAGHMTGETITVGGGVHTRL